ncbi:MAG: N-acetylmuramoyl-L-alanine amidase [Bryobacterales bacterium]|nr:N-acetylmuramoyl-L-alanine amidase [Bryobacterales bacterium]
MIRTALFLPTAGALLLALCTQLPVLAASKRETAAKRYKAAEQLYEDLRHVPGPELRPRQYEVVISAFEAVHRTDPSSGYCDDALLAIGELYQAMAERFQQDRYHQKAREAYEFMAREYPSSGHRQKALAMAAELGGLPATASTASGGTSAPADGGRVVKAALSDAEHEADSVVQPPGYQTRGAGLVSISKIRHHSYSDGTRIVLEMDGKTALKYDRLSRPDRLYIDLFGSIMSKSLIKGVQVVVADTLLSTARLAQNRGNKARLVLDLKRPTSFDVFWLDNPTRFVLDVRGAGAPRSPRTVQALDPGHTELKPPRAAETTADGKHSLTRALGLKLGTILVDAGHGGHDTGSIGPGGLREKDVVLDISQRLGKLLEERLGAEVIYTRQSDVFVPLEERPQIANSRKADLMISIHCNSAPSSKVRGIETYYLSLTSDSWELSVASLENAAASSSIHDLEDLVAKIAFGEKTEESREFAKRVQERLHEGVSKHSSSIRNRGIRKAPFVVLVGAQMPAVLAEIGFISNRSDEGLLKQSGFRQEVAEHLFKGIAEYATSLGTPTVRTSLSAGSAQRD